MQVKQRLSKNLTETFENAIILLIFRRCIGGAEVLSMATKDSVLNLLLSADGEISGSDIAKALNISRNAVWKAIHALKDDGWEIAAATNRGYRLVCEGLCETTVRQYLKTEHFGTVITVLKSVDSTNNYLKMHPELPDGTVVAARGQTGGRGRRGRNFSSPMDKGIYFSLCYRPKLSGEEFDPGTVTTAAAIAVCHAIERLTPLKAGIKWVNDIFVCGKKCCGILTEGIFDLETAQVDRVIIGIGVNVGRMLFPKEIANIATSLQNETDGEISRPRLLAEILNELEPLLQNPNKAALIKEAGRRSVILGKKVLVKRADGDFEATALKLDECGHLLVQKGDEILTLSSGEVSIKKL